MGKKGKSLKSAYWQNRISHVIKFSFGVYLFRRDLPCLCKNLPLLKQNVLNVLEGSVGL